MERQRSSSVAPNGINRRPRSPPTSLGVSRSVSLGGALNNLQGFLGFGDDDDDEYDNMYNSAVGTFAYSRKDVASIVNDNDEFQRLKATLKAKGAITNEVLKQRLHFYLKAKKDRDAQGPPITQQPGKRKKKVRRTRSEQAALGAAVFRNGNIHDNNINLRGGDNQKLMVQQQKYRHDKNTGLRGDAPNRNLMAKESDGANLAPKQEDIGGYPKRNLMAKESEHANLIAKEPGDAKANLAPRQENIRDTVNLNKHGEGGEAAGDHFASSRERGDDVDFAQPIRASTSAAEDAPAILKKKEDAPYHPESTHNSSGFGAAGMHQQGIATWDNTQFNLMATVAKESDDATGNLAPKQEDIRGDRNGSLKAKECEDANLAPKQEINRDNVHLKMHSEASDHFTPSRERGDDFDLVLPVSSSATTRAAAEDALATKNGVPHPAETTNKSTELRAAGIHQGDQFTRQQGVATAGDNTQCNSTATGDDCHPSMPRLSAMDGEGSGNEGTDPAMVTKPNAARGIDAPESSVCIEGQLGDTSNKTAAEFSRSPTVQAANREALLLPMSDAPVVRATTTTPNRARSDDSVDSPPPAARPPVVEKASAAIPRQPRRHLSAKRVAVSPNNHNHNKEAPISEDARQKLKNSRGSHHLHNKNNGFIPLRKNHDDTSNNNMSTSNIDISYSFESCGTTNSRTRFQSPLASSSFMTNDSNFTLDFSGAGSFTTTTNDESLTASGQADDPPSSLVVVKHAVQAFKDRDTKQTPGRAATTIQRFFRLALPILKQAHSDHQFWEKELELVQQRTLADLKDVAGQLELAKRMAAMEVEQEFCRQQGEQQLENTAALIQEKQEEAKRLRDEVAQEKAALEETQAQLRQAEHDKEQLMCVSDPWIEEKTALAQRQIKRLTKSNEQLSRFVDKYKDECEEKKKIVDLYKRTGRDRREQRKRCDRYTSRVIQMAQLKLGSSGKSLVKQIKQMKRFNEAECQEAKIRRKAGEQQQHSTKDDVELENQPNSTKSPQKSPSRDSSSIGSGASKRQSLIVGSSPKDNPTNKRISSDKYKNHEETAEMTRFGSEQASTKMEPNPAEDTAPDDKPIDIQKPDTNKRPSRSSSLTPAAGVHRKRSSTAATSSSDTKQQHRRSSSRTPATSEDRHRSRRRSSSRAPTTSTSDPNGRHRSRRRSSSRTSTTTNPTSQNHRRRSSSRRTSSSTDHYSKDRRRSSSKATAPTSSRGKSSSKQKRRTSKSDQKVSRHRPPRTMSLSRASESRTWKPSKGVQRKRLKRCTSLDSYLFDLCTHSSNKREDSAASPAGALITAAKATERNSILGLAEMTLKHAQAKGSLDHGKSSKKNLEVL